VTAPALVLSSIELDPNTLFTGAMTGLAYAVLATGLVLVYRATRVINFAYGDIGAIGGGVLAKLVLDHGVPYWVAFPIVVVLGALLGGAVELIVVRRLFDAPRLILLVATIGVAQLLYGVALLQIDIENQSTFPSPITRTAEVFGLRIFGADFLALALLPAVIAGVALFLARTPYGIAVRAAATNGDAARLAGISVKRVSTLVWVISGVLATVTVLVYKPLRDPTTGIVAASFGPSLLLRALAAGLIGKLQSVPLAVVGGLGLGVVEAVLLANIREPGLVNVVFAALVVVLVLVRGRSLGAADDGGSSGLVAARTPVPAELRGRAWVRRMPAATRVAILAGAVLLPVLFGSSSQVLLFSRVCVFALIALSITVLTGWAGQLSLGQFGFVGLGAVVTTGLVRRGMPFGVAVAYGVVACTVVALLVGLPALRVKGLFLAVTTIGFAVAVDSWVVRRPIFVGNNTSVATVDRPRLGPFDFRSQTAYYYLCLAALVAVASAVSRLRSTGIGRGWIAVRDNEPSAAAFTLSPTRLKLGAFALAGGIAGLAGGLLAGLNVQIRPDSFGAAESLQIVALAIIGGVGSAGGAVLGAVWVVGVPTLFSGTPSAAALTSGPALLVLLLYLPGGLWGAVQRARTALLDAIAARVAPRAVEIPANPASARSTLRTQSSDATRTAEPIEGHALEGRDITVRFGGRTAVDGVSIHAAPGEVVGLIGANGAGKSTLMNALSGFVPGTGMVLVEGVDVSALPAHERARAGLGRAFQDARLFGDLTVRESIQVALEARETSELVPSLFGFPPARRAERRKRAEADDLVELLGLPRYADTGIRALSTGTRRIAELACLLALDARVLLLDEPTAGVAQRETEAFGPLIRRIQQELGATVLIIEHDIPLVMSMSDRIVCMGAGRVIVEGLPEQVRNDPEVIANYLGTDDRAIERSDLAPSIGGTA
jgi:ABC-type branched-subunit amino acid transport system ATPase component/ABC-type branched-subunit amino acid transport system permease subunit